MKAKGQGRWVQRRRQPAAGVSRARAAEIARLKLAREMIGCEVFDEVPAGWCMYQAPPLPKNCWFAICGPVNRNMLDGPAKVLLCISKRTGRILFRTEIRSGG
ncbi:MAG: hypothetical protein NTV49_05185 [Kiritimatiellaeota bacterium]|nr:hypothetical protein [Kiritimatiellota bacterium]